MKKLLSAVLFVALLPVFVWGADKGKDKSGRLFQVALLQSLMRGEYDGVITVGELKGYGDTGIGTFQGVNGEMIVLDGTVYRALWDGSVEVAPDGETVPFSNVTFFDADIKKEHVSAASAAELKSILSAVVEEHGRNQFYMAKVTGLMPSILVRSVVKQKEPYRPLDEALKTDQREFAYTDIRGTLVALCCPDYMAGLNTPGWHLHFLSEDGKKGGHVLDLAVQDALLALDVISEFAMVVPNRASFNDKDLAADMREAIEQVEGK